MAGSLKNVKWIVAAIVLSVAWVTWLVARRVYWDEFNAVTNELESALPVAFSAVASLVMLAFAAYEWKTIETRPPCVGWNVARLVFLILGFLVFGSLFVWRIAYVT